VRSALEQSHPVSEIVIVDDASSDDTAAVVRQLAEQNSRIKLLESATNAGPAHARNQGFAMATGDWIAVLDADDAYLPDRIARMIAVSEGADIVADRFLFYDAQKDEIGQPLTAPSDGWDDIDMLAFVEVRRGYQSYGLLKPMFRRAFIEKHRLAYPENCRHGEDYFFVAEALAAGAIYRLLRWPGYLYTMRNAGWSRTAVDYKGLAANHRAFAGRADLNLSPAVRAKMMERVSYAEELHVRHMVKTAARKRRFREVLWLAVRHHAARKMMAAAAVRRVVRTFGRASSPQKS
jgi:succinoglycan biosynthesis protein ExoO